MSGLEMTKCYYPDYSSEENDVFVIGEHRWGKDNYCIICGEARFRLCTKCNGTGGYLTHDLEGFVIERICNHER